MSMRLIFSLRIGSTRSMILNDEKGVEDESVEVRVWSFRNVTGRKFGKRLSDGRSHLITPFKHDDKDFVQCDCSGRDFGGLPNLHMECFAVDNTNDSPHSTTGGSLITDHDAFVRPAQVGI